MTGASGLVGRVHELTTLRSALAASPSVIVLEGEPGIGKSRLVAELRAEKLGPGGWLVGYCEPLREPLPLGPVLDALRTATPPAGLNPVAGALAPLVPELADRLPPAPPALADPQADRHRVFRAAVALLAGLGPAVLVLEDLHWADDGTRDFLAFLASHLPPHLAVLLTTRPDEHAQPQWYEALGRSRVTRPVRVRLPPLRPDDVAVLAQRALPAPLPEPAATALWERTAGIPFAVEEVLRTLAERASAGADPPAGLAALGVPTGLRDALLQRLRALDEPAPRVVEAAAVLGDATDVDLLATVLERDAGEVARCLERALAAGLLTESGGGCRFRHALARQAVDEALPAPTRRWLHLAAAQALAARSGAAPVARLAYHYRHADRPVEFARYAEAAADLALAHGDDATAARHLLQTMDVPGAPVRLAVKLGRAAVDGLAQSEAVPILQRLLAGDPLPVAARGELRFMLGRLLRQQGEQRQGYEEVERAVPDLQPSPGLQARALALLAVPDTVVGRHVREHRERCGQAEEAARRSGDPRVAAAVEIARASLLLELGDPSARQLIARVRADPRFLDDPRERARAYLNWAQGALHAGHLGLADSLLAEGRQIVAEAGYLRLAGIVGLVEAAVDRAAGRWQGLPERIRGLLSNEFAAADVDAQFLLGSLLAATGSEEEAVARLRDAVGTAHRVGAIWPLVPARAALARLLLTAGDTAGAREQSRLALAEVRVKGGWAWGAEVVLGLVDIADSAPAAEEAVAELSRELSGVDAPAAQAVLRICQAAAARATGGGEADRLLTEARRRLRRIGMPYELALATERQGLWRCERGEPGGPLLQHALRLLGGLGAHRDLARVRATMRRHGVPVPYPFRGGRRAYGSALSPREREVAQLAATGRTNQEIADRLFLSRRTVESHVASALRKLAGSSRKQLATLLTQAGPPAGEA